MNSIPLFFYLYTHHNFEFFILFLFEKYYNGICCSHFSRWCNSDCNKLLCKTISPEYGYQQFFRPFTSILWSSTFLVLETLFPDLFPQNIERTSIFLLLVIWKAYFLFPKFRLFNLHCKSVDLLLFFCVILI